MIYLDTGCLVKLYYPEPDSAKVAAVVQGKTICYSPLHELELVNALRLKVFLKSASPAQVIAARALVETDLQTGVLVSTAAEWHNVFPEAVKLADQHTGTLGCRSLDILHCAAAKMMNVGEFVSTDARQTKLANAIGLKLTVI